MLKSVAISTIACLLAALSFGCEDSIETTSTGAQDKLPAGLVAATAPQGAKGVAELRASAKDGDQVVVRGVVAGREDPIAENRAALTLLDTGVKTCDKNAGDTCATPWDACCEPADVIAANSITVQVVNPQGTPLKVGLGGVDGLAPLKRVVVAGQYKTAGDGQAGVVNAESIHIEKN